jgi:hypothetical protein
MKIPAATVEAMAEAIGPLDTEQARLPYRDGTIQAVRDIDRRYRWDLLWASGANRLLWEIDDLTDAHIDTALRRIVEPLEPTS